MEPLEQFFDEWIRDGLPTGQGLRFTDLSREQVAELEASESFAHWRLANALKECQLAIGRVVKSARRKVQQFMSINGKEK